MIGRLEFWASRYHDDLILISFALFAIDANLRELVHFM